MNPPPMAPLTLAAAVTNRVHLSWVKCSRCARVVVYATAIALAKDPPLLVEAVTRAALSDGCLMYPQAAVWHCAACAAASDPTCPGYIWAAGARASYLRQGLFCKAVS